MHCGGLKHTKESCFHLIGFPEWWTDRKKKIYDGKKGKGAAHVTVARIAPVVASETGAPTYQRVTMGANSQPFHNNAKQDIAEAHTVTTHDGSNSWHEGSSFEPGGKGKGQGKNHLSENNFNSRIKSKEINKWVIDSGATDHMTNSEIDLSHIVNSNKSGIINANGETYPVEKMGKAQISEKMTLNNTLLVPSLSTKLISIGKLTDDLNCVVLIFPDFCVFQDIQTREILGRGFKKDGLYYLDNNDLGRIYSTRSESTSLRDKLWLRHKRLGHPSFGYMKKLFPTLCTGLNDEHFICETCIKAKSHRSTYHLSNNKSQEPFDLVHSDVWGPSPTISKSGYRWFVLFTDDCTRMTWLYLLKTKDEVSTSFRNFYNMVKTQFRRSIKMVRSDNGREYVNQNLQKNFTENGIIHETSCVGTPQQNGIAERKNRQILETARSLLFENHVPQYFWDNVVSTAVYLLNRVPSKANDFKTPLQALAAHVDIPSYLNLPPKIFGCLAYVHVQKKFRSKIEPYAEKCVFLGFGSHQKGYKCYNPKTHKFYTTMDVTFIENKSYFMDTQIHVQGETINEPEIVFSDLAPNNVSELPCVHNSTNKNLDLGEGLENSENTISKSTGSNNYSDDSPIRSNTLRLAQGSETSRDENNGVNMEMIEIEADASNEEIIQSDPQPLSQDLLVDIQEVSSLDQNYNSQFKLPNRSNRGMPPKWYIPEEGVSKRIKYPITNYTKASNFSEPLRNFALQVSSVPTKFEEAIQDSNWVAAMKSEMEALEKNHTWKLLDLPEGKKTVGCKWVYSIKYNAEGKIERYKARLVAKGYTQTYGIDFQETFSPVAKLNTVRVLLSLAANLDWSLHQFDVKNAFLHGDLKEEIYMDIPPGYQCHETKGKVCKLEKSLYGLKQSPRAWFGRFCSAMKGYGYTQSNSDHTLFYRQNQGKIAILIIYVDDMIITGDNHEEIQTLEKRLCKEFEMKNLGNLRYFLGIEVARNKDTIFLSQRKYILDLLAEVGLLECKPVETPFIQNQRLRTDLDQTPVDREKYQRLVGKLIYLSHTRPDIAYAVNVVSQFMHSPKEEHMEAVMRILRYLKGALGRGLMFRKNGHLNVIGYTDADWAGCIDDRRSTAGYFTFVGGNLVTWRSKKQNVVSLSSAEAEFRGMVKGICELLWIRKVLTELGFEPNNEMKLFCDNKAAIDISHNPVLHDRTKHIEIDKHFIREKIDSKIIEIPFVRSGEQIADMLTKAVTGKVFNQFLERLGMGDIYVSA
jgi:transposase InsO family protein